MKNKNPGLNVANVYDRYRDTRDTRPSADLDPMLSAANDAVARRSGDVVNVSEVSHAEVSPSWDDSDELEKLSLLYRQWKSSRVTPTELSDIRERIVNETLAVARVRSQMDTAANTKTVAQGSRSGVAARVSEFFGSMLGGVGFAPAALAAVVAAVVLVLAPMSDRKPVDDASLASISGIGLDFINRSGDLVGHISAGIESNFGFSKSTSPQGRAFGLGVGSMDLVMALRSGNADKTLEVTRHLVGLSQAQELGAVKTSATAVFEEISSRPEVSRVVFSRSMHLLTEMKNAFVSTEERTLFELGQWVEAVYLLSSNGIETGDTSSLGQTLTSAQQRLAGGALISGLNESASASLTSLSKINAVDGVVLAEARLARDLSIRIKSLIE